MAGEQIRQQRDNLTGWMQHILTVCDRRYGLATTTAIWVVVVP